MSKAMRSAGSLTRDYGSLNQASPFMIYLDPLDSRGRNKELAQNLRETLLKL